MRFDQFFDENFILEQFKKFFEGSLPTFNGSERSPVSRGLFQQKNNERMTRRSEDKG